jgi:hypothetical protein
MLPSDSDLRSSVLDAWDPYEMTPAIIHRRSPLSRISLRTRDDDWISEVLLLAQAIKAIVASHQKSEAGMVARHCEFLVDQLLDLLTDPRACTTLSKDDVEQAFEIADQAGLEWSSISRAPLRQIPLIVVRRLLKRGVPLDSRSPAWGRFIAVHGESLELAA